MRRASRGRVGAGILVLAGLFTSASASTTATTTATGAAPPAGAAAFGALPAMQSPALSPGGGRFAWIERGAGGSRVIAMDVDDPSRTRTIPVGRDVKPRSVLWADDRTLLIEVSATHEVQRRRQYEFFRTIAVDYDGAAPARMLLMREDRRWVTGADLVALQGSRPGTVLMATREFVASADMLTDSRITKRTDGWRYALFEVDTRTGAATLVDTGTPETDQWLAGPDGRVVARADWLRDAREFRLYVPHDGGWRELMRSTGAVLTLCGLTADGQAIVLVGAAGSDRARVWAQPLDGSPMRVLYEHPQHAVEGVVRDPRTRAPIAVTFGGPEPGVHWLDAGAEATAVKLARAFPGRRVEIAGQSTSGHRVLAAVDGPSTPTTHYLVDFERRRADVAAEAYPQLAGVPLGEVEITSYPARDGTTIPAYVTYPPGRPRAGLAMVVLPHGGPASRDYPEFDWLAQFLATRGYVVLQPQFRGSTGFGRAHQEAGYREWGGRMQDDVTDGVRALVERGVADPLRVCIVGASYGGYAALAGATQTPDLYACAVSINGVADLPEMLAYVNRRTGEGSGGFRYFEEFIGHPWKVDMQQRSPARNARLAKAPILLLHGEDDVVVPIAQSRLMARALDSAGRPHSLVTLEGEDHWLSGAETRTRVLQELERFLGHHLALR